MGVSNTLAYYDTVTITTVESFRVLAHSCKLVIPTTTPFQPSLIFANKARANPSRAFSRHYTKGKLLALPQNIRLGLNLLVVVKTGLWTQQY